MANILVVEDSLTVSNALERVLTLAGHTVRTAGDGLVALSALRVFDPDLVLLDVRLPHVDGVQLCMVIRRLKNFEHLPVVMLSGLSAPVDIERALRAGANDYLIKPIADETLLEVIDNLLNSTPEARSHHRRFVISGD